MGGIKIITPSSEVVSKKIISRLQKIPSSDEMGKTGFLELKKFERKNSDGLKSIKIQKVFDLDANNVGITLDMGDLAWLYSKHSDNKSIGWNGFRQLCHLNSKFDISKIIPMPFVNNPPSDWDTIYTTLMTAAETGRTLNQSTVFVTFDLPLYIKAREILECIKQQNDSNLSSVVAVLGGFHMAMSYMGGVGFIMEGSGFTEAVCEIYAENSAVHILSGHAYARAIRAHSLIHLALSELIFCSMELSETQKSQFDAVLLQLGTENFISELNKEPFNSIKKEFISQISKLKNKGPTAQLWVQYWQWFKI